MASLHLSLLICLVACSSAGPDNQGVASIDHIAHTDHTDHKELPNPTEGVIRDLVTSSEVILGENWVDKFTLR